MENFKTYNQAIIEKTEDEQKELIKDFNNVAKLDLEILTIKNYLLENNASEELANLELIYKILNEQKTKIIKNSKEAIKPKSGGDRRDSRGGDRRDRGGDRRSFGGGDRRG